MNYLSNKKNMMLVLLCALLLSGCGGIKKKETVLSTNTPFIENNSTVQENSVLDITPPTIILKGENPLTLKTGEVYIEQGAIATDDVDGNITTDIVINNSTVDTSVEGNYTVSYDVNDSATNHALQTRTVIVKNKSFVGISKEILSRYDKIKTLVENATKGIYINNKKPLYLIAGDSTRDASYAEHQLLFHKTFKKMNIDYVHTAVSSIDSPRWMEGIINGGEPNPIFAIYAPKVKPAIDKYGAANTILEYSLGINDWNHQPSQRADIEKYNNVKNGIRKAIQTIMSDYPNINIYMIAPSVYNKKTSSTLQKIYTELSKELSLPMMVSPDDSVFRTEDIEDDLIFSRDGVHPSYLGSRRLIHGIVSFIGNPNNPVIKDILTNSESLYSDTSSKLDINLAEGLTIVHQVMAFDNPKLITSRENARGIKIPVIGGSIVKIKNPSNGLNIKLLSKGESYLNNIGIAYSDMSSRASETSVIGKRIDIDPMKVQSEDNFEYKYIYVPKGTDYIFIGINLYPVLPPEAKDAGLTLGEWTDKVLEENPLDVRYATVENMRKWHPDISEVRNYDKKKVLPIYSIDN